MKIIRFNHIWKQYTLNQAHGLKHAIIQAVKRRRQRRPDFWALQDVSFELAQGEIIGIVGPNGSGKSTILKLLSGITVPTRGTIETQGRIGALINLGAGFHPELTGRENIYLYGSIMGLKRAQIHQQFEQIVEFADLGDFIDTPVKRYSSGMFVRLGFATAIHTNPDILLIDEVLAVGDFRFQDKCIAKIREIKNQGVTMIVVSHQRHTIEKLCQTAVFLHHGKVQYQGPVVQALDHYFEAVSGQGASPSSYNAPLHDSYDDREVHITSVELLGKNQQPKNAFLTDDALCLRIAFRANVPVTAPVVYARIFYEHEVYRDEIMVHATETGYFRLHIDFQDGEYGVAELNFPKLRLLAGQYFFNVGILKDVLSTYSYDQLDRAASFIVTSSLQQGVGIAYLPHEWRFQKQHS